MLPGLGHAGVTYLLPELEIKLGIEDLMVILARPVPARLPIIFIYTPVDNTPLQSMLSKGGTVSDDDTVCLPYEDRNSYPTRDC